MKSHFYIKWGDTTSKLNPDIGGNMTKAIKESGKILDCTVCLKEPDYSSYMKQDASNISQCLFPHNENVTLLLEICKLFGKDVNVVTAFELFKKANYCYLDRKGKRAEFTLEEQRKQFNAALHNLRYIGYLSATRTSTFLFKKNYFGKPSMSYAVLPKQGEVDDITSDKEVTQMMGLSSTAAAGGPPQKKVGARK